MLVKCMIRECLKHVWMKSVYPETQKTTQNTTEKRDTEYYRKEAEPN